MLVLGLTGSIGMGKSTAAGMFRSLGLPVHDADAAVHLLFRKGGAAVRPVRRRFPEAVGEDGVDRERLGRLVFGDAAALADLEAIVHPLVAASRDRFLGLHRRCGRRAAVLDVPLLFETGGARLCDRVLVVSAPAFLQRQRVLARPGMTPARLSAILKKQMPDGEKRRRADYTLPTGLGRAVTMQNIKRILHHLGVRHA